MSGVSLSRYVNPPRKYLRYDGNDEVIGNTEDIVINEFEEVNNDIKEVNEEYIGQRMIKRLMSND